MIVSIVILALVSSYCAASFSYDCDTRGGEMDSEKYWRGTYKKGVLPCEFQEIDMPAGYNKSENPQSPNTEISVTIYSPQFLEDVEKCNVTVNAFFGWTDRRLKFVENNNATTESQIRVPLSATKHVWNPGPQVLIVEPDIGAYYGVRMTEEGLSSLYLSKENDTDFVRFEAWFRKSVILQSISGYEYYPNDKHEFILYHDLGLGGRWVSPSEVFLLPEFSHASFKIHYASQNTSAEADPYMLDEAQRKVVIVFSRKLQSYVIRTYLPSGSFVLLSWLSMLVPAELATERVALCTATLLTITTFFNTASQLGPPVSYLRAYDIWLLGCIMFVFIILFENIAVMKITGRFNKLLSKPAAAGDNSKLEKSFENILKLQLRMGAGERRIHDDNDEQQQEFITVKSESGRDTRKSGLNGEERGDDDNDSREKFEVGRRVDRVAIFVLTAAILVCNVIYWSWLLATKQTWCERDIDCSRGM